MTDMQHHTPHPEKAPFPDGSGRGLTKAQRDLLVEMGFVPHVLRNSDEQSPRWYIEGGGAVKHNVAGALIKQGYVRFTAKWGGHPGILGFTVTPKGRAALSKATGGQHV